MLGWLTRPVTLVAALAFSTISVLSRKYRRLRLYYHLFLYTSTLGVLSVWGVLVSIAATITGHVSIRSAYSDDRIQLLAPVCPVTS